MDYHAWVVTTSGPVECWVVDYSATGLRLEVPEKLEVQSVGALEFRSQYFKYEVLHDSSIGTKRNHPQDDIREAGSDRTRHSTASHLPPNQGSDGDWLRRFYRDRHTLAFPALR